MSVTLFLLRGFYSEIELNLVNLIPYLLSSVIGSTLVFLYLYIFPSQRKDKFLTFFIPGVVLMVLIITTGLSSLWLIDELILMLCFIFGGQELSTPESKSL
jgi:Na+/melibiose symporter-like transporter